MCRFKLIVLLALACLAVASACDTPADPNQPGPTAAPTTTDAENVARSFLDGWVKLHLGLEGSLERGAAAASIVCARRGAQPPTSAEVDDLIAERT